MKFKKPMFSSLCAFDKGVFGFGRKRFWKMTLREGCLALRIAVDSATRQVCGYAGLQKDIDGAPVLRWLIANNSDMAQRLLCCLLSDFQGFRDHGVWVALYLRSHTASELLKHMDTSQLQPWMLIFNRREPFLQHKNIVALTYI